MVELFQNPWPHPEAREEHENFLLEIEEAKRKAGRVPKPEQAGSIRISGSKTDIGTRLFKNKSMCNVHTHTETLKDR